MDKCLEVLQQVEQQQSPRLLADHGLVCRQLPFDDESLVLYVSKPRWTNRFDDTRESTVGFFFSLWVTSALIEQQQFSYNIHALRLRKLVGYKLTSRKFAEEFRDAVRSRVAEWPGISMDCGPQTLLEGREQYDPESFATRASERIDDFVTIHQVLDELLDRYATG